MSSFSVEVVEIPAFGQHPNADTLSIVSLFGCPVIFRTEEFRALKKAVYIPVDAMVPLDMQAFAFLRNEKYKPGKKHRMKAKKLRGIFSMGMLVPISALEPEVQGTLDWELGTDISQHLGITKYEEPLDPVSFGKSQQESDPGVIPHYDMESYRKYKNVLIENEQIVVTEKLHGCNARYFWHVKEGSEPRFYAGSHGQFKKFHETNLWWKIAIQYDLENKLKPFPNLALYGEVVGTQDLRYGAKQGETFFTAFDLYNIEKGKFEDYDAFWDFCTGIGVPTVPLIYRGPYLPEYMETLSRGDTTLAPGQIREGIVIRPIKERWNYETGRTLLKFVSEDYLLRKGGSEYK